jgi:hypothetical protein
LRPWLKSGKIIGIIRKPLPKTKGEMWTEVIQVMVSERMKKKIQELAIEDDVSASAFARTLLTDAVERDIKRRERKRWEEKKEEKRGGDKRGYAAEGIAETNRRLKLERKELEKKEQAAAKEKARRIRKAEQQREFMKRKKEKLKEEKLKAERAKVREREAPIKAAKKAEEERLKAEREAERYANSIECLVAEFTEIHSGLKPAVSGIDKELAEGVLDAFTGKAHLGVMLKAEEKPSKVHPMDRFPGLK